MKSLCTHLTRWALLLLMLSAAIAWAEDGILTHLSGPVSVLQVDGKTVPGLVGTRISAGDTVITGPGGYVRLEMSDGGEMVLRPDSQLKVEHYTFVKAKREDDSFVLSMMKGGLRAITGLIGKRGNKDAYELKTSNGTIGIRGTQFDLRVCLANCGALADGTYLLVRYGAVQASNAQGSLAVAAGQVAFMPPNRPPVLLPRDPGIGFTPPPLIPKLDEKKKLQPVATDVATPTQAAASASEPASAQPAASPVGAPDASVPAASSEAATPAASSEAATSAAAAEAAAQATAATIAPAVDILPSGPLAGQPATGGADCVVQ